jgi:hypothetical protein
MEKAAWERVPMKNIAYQHGEDEDRYVLLVVTRYGGDPVSPLYERQARALMKKARDAGQAVRLIRCRPDEESVLESDF